MYALILTEGRAQGVDSILDQKQILSCDYCTAEIPGVNKVFEGVMRVPADTLILDADAGTEKDLIEGIKLLKIQRKIRVILLAPGRVPGDSLVASLVAKGVYDIVDHANWVQQLQYVLSQEPAEYSNAARWDVQEQDYSASDGREDKKLNIPWKEIKKPIKSIVDTLMDRGPESKLIEIDETVREVVEREVVGTITICVASAEKGVGSTYTALTIASYLARRNLSVAVMELPDPAPTEFSPSSLDMLSRTYRDEVVKKSKNCFSLRNIDFYFVDEETRENKYFEAFNQDYKYYIMDIGYIRPRPEGLNKYIQEMRRSSLSVLVANASPWRGGELASLFSAADKVSDLAGYLNWKIVFSAPDEKFYRPYKTAFSKRRIETFDLPYNPDPFIEHILAEEVLYNLLSTVLTSPGKRKGKVWPFKK